MHVEWWITEQEEVKYLARRAQRNRLGLWGVSQDAGRQSCWHLHALHPACAATPPLLTDCWLRWQDRCWECIKGDKQETRTAQSRKKKKKKVILALPAVSFATCWSTAELTLRSQEPSSAAAQGISRAPSRRDIWQQGIGQEQELRHGIGWGLSATTWRPGEVVGLEPELLPIDSLFVFPEWINTNPKY